MQTNPELIDMITKRHAMVIQQIKALSQAATDDNGGFVPFDPYSSQLLDESRFLTTLFVAIADEVISEIAADEPEPHTVSPPPAILTHPDPPLTSSPDSPNHTAPGAPHERSLLGWCDEIERAATQ